MFFEFNGMSFSITANKNICWQVEIYLGLSKINQPAVKAS
jgi:hypothetical protein